MLKYEQIFRTKKYELWLEYSDISWNMIFAHRGNGGGIILYLRYEKIGKKNFEISTLNQCKKFYFGKII